MTTKCLECLDVVTGAARFIAFNAPFLMRSIFCCQRAQIPNFVKVSDRLFRGGQPNAAGFQTLHERYKVQTIVNLRVTDTNRPLLTSVGLLNESTTTTSRDAARSSVASLSVYFDPDTSKHDPVFAKETARKAAWEFLKIMHNPASGTIYLHCYYGKERTGTLVAIARMVFDNWSHDRAITELLADPGFHAARHPQLVEFVRTFDVRSAQKELANMSSSSSSTTSSSSSSTTSSRSSSTIK